MSSSSALRAAAAVFAAAVVATTSPAVASAQSGGDTPALSPEQIAQALGPGGDPAAATQGILSLAEAAEADEATLWVQVLVIMERVERDAGALAVRAAALAAVGSGSAGAEMIVQALPELSAEDWPVFLAFAAVLAEAEEPLRAAELRERFLQEHPDAPQRPEIALRHARWLVSIDARRAEGVRLLEDLIVEVPNHPLAPEARRVYQMYRAGLD